MPRRPTAAFFAVAFALSLASAASSCADDDEAGDPTRDAASETPLLGDTAPPDPDAEPPPGNVCGDPAGLDPSAPWPLRGGCPRRGGFSARNGPQTAATSWEAPIPAGESSPAVAASFIWVGTNAGDVVALTYGGDVAGAFRTGGPVRSSPAMAKNGTAVVGGSDGILYGLRAAALPIGDGGADADGGATFDAGDGAVGPPAVKVFAREVGPMSSSPVIGADGTIYVGTTDGKLVAVSADGSATKWSATTNDKDGSSPAIGAAGTIYVGSSDGKLYAVGPDGKEKWAADLGSPVTTSPAVGGNDTIYVGTKDGKLHARDPDGKEKWSYATGGPITGGPAVYAGTVCVGSEDKKLHAVSTIDGKARWTFTTLGAVASPLITKDGTVYVGATDGKLYAVYPTGTLFFAVNVKGRVKSAPGLGSDQTLYVATDNGIVAVGP